MICDLYLPFSIVSHPSFKRFVHRFDISYEIPDRHTISHSLVPNLSKKMMENLIDCIKGCLFAAMTADGWKSRMRHKYLNVNIHFIDAHWIFRSACIGVDELTDETAAGHMNLIHLMCNPYKGLLQKLVGLIADNTNVNPAAARLMGLVFYGCFPHGVNLVVVSGIECKLVAPIFNKIRKARNVISASGPCLRELAFAQEDLEIPKHILLGDCLTRWGSSWMMGGRYIEQAPAVEVNCKPLFLGDEYFPNII